MGLTRNNKILIAISALILAIVVVYLAVFNKGPGLDSQELTETAEIRESLPGISGDAKIVDDFIAKRAEYKNIYVKKADLVMREGSYKLLDVYIYNTESEIELDYSVITFKDNVVVGPGEDIVDGYLARIGVPKNIITKYDEGFADGYMLEE